MKASNRFWLLTLLLPGVLFLNACSNTGGSERPQVSGSVQSVYGGYGYPYYGYYDGDYYEDRAEYAEQQQQKRQVRREQRRENRPHTQPVRENRADRTRLRTSTGMGRPSRMQMGGGMSRMPRGGGLRRR